VAAQVRLQSLLLDESLLAELDWTLEGLFSGLHISNKPTQIRSAAIIRLARRCLTIEKKLISNFDEDEEDDDV